MKFKGVCLGTLKFLYQYTLFNRFDEPINPSKRINKFIKAYWKVDQGECRKTP